MQQTFQYIFLSLVCLVLALIVGFPATADTSDHPFSNMGPGLPNTGLNPVLSQQVRAVTVNLSKGITSNSVAILQQFLISQNKGSAAQALANVGATAYFGALTHAALAEFQASVGISPAAGYFGPITRGYINSHY